MFYDIYTDLCQQKGVSKTKAALEIGLSNATPTKWKNTGATPEGATLQKIADYFGVSVGYLLGTEDKKTPTAKAEGVQYTDMELLAAFRNADERTRDAIRTLLGIKEDS